MAEGIPLTPAQASLLRNVHIVLVQPEEPANIGAVARAIKNTGLGRLVLVQAERTIPQAAFWVAHASEDVLQQARIVPDLREALADTRLAVGTTQRPRVPHFPVIPPEEAARRLLEAAHSGPVAIVFGRESRGLDNAELYQCALWSRIPSPVTHPAYNLAQAVLIYAYTVYRSVQEAPVYQTAHLASHREYEAFYDRLQRVLELAEFRSKDGMERFMARVRRALANMPLESRDLAVLMKILDAILKKLPAKN